MRKSNATIEQHAKDFLKKFNIDGSIPVPIEQIVEIELGITIIPRKGLLMEDSIDGFLSHDCETIYIDEDTYMSQANNRARFTLAHELGHLFMHKAYREAEKKVILSFNALKRPVPEHNKIIPYVASSIAKMFEVSDQVAEIRLKNVLNKS